jgi:hypothetical protein
MNVHEIEPFPTNEEVLAHGFDFRPDWWLPRVEESWGAFLNDLPVAERGRGYHHITRRDLLTISQDRTPGGNGRLLLACYVWGTGDGAWQVGRRALVFRETPPDVLGERLTAARQVLDRQGPPAAYEALDDGGPCRTKNMRASFFTKFLYAADAPGDGSHGRALILDQFVAIALNDLHGWDLPEQSGWSPETYQRWLDLAHDRAGQASERTGSPVRADAVEIAYFKHGQHLAQARRAQSRP